jgi:hypothetical protein
MRWAWLSLLLPLACGCRGDAELAGADLSSAALYCPSDPPLTTPFVCEPTAIPYCTYLTQQVICTCSLDTDGGYRLRCASIRSDGGAPSD